jgi:hypothetical protein
LREALRSTPSDRPGLLALLCASVLAGLVIALLTVHLAGNWEQYFG